jgi:hypothetical protein
LPAGDTISVDQRWKNRFVKSPISFNKAGPRKGHDPDDHNQEGRRFRGGSW